MYAPEELHILAASAGLTDEAVTTLWSQARADALAEHGDASAPEYDHATHKRMMRLIEHAATEGIPPDLVPWVMFDVHVGAFVAHARHGASAAASYIKEHLPGKRAA